MSMMVSMRVNELARSEVVYEILVRGQIGESLATDLGALRLEARQDQTLIVIAVIDQAHLHGVLERLRDLNVDIESVNPA